MFQPSGVAPFAGAWIETYEDWKVTDMSPSLPSRERGLKLKGVDQYNYMKRSLPSRERGLKL